MDSWITGWAHWRVWWGAARQRKSRPLDEGLGFFLDPVPSRRSAVPAAAQDPPAILALDLSTTPGAEVLAARCKPAAGVKYLLGTERSNPIPGLHLGRQCSFGAVGLSRFLIRAHANLHCIDLQREAGVCHSKFQTPFSIGRHCPFKDYLMHHSLRLKRLARVPDEDWLMSS